MPKFFKAATNIVKVPKKMIFLDKKGQSHLYDTLTPKHHLSNHYGQSAVITDYNSKNGNLLKVSKGEYTQYTDKVKKQKKAAKVLVKATDAVETAVKKMRGRPRKNLSTSVVSTVPKILRYRRGKEEIAVDNQVKADEKAFKKAEKQFIKAKKQEDKIIAKTEKQNRIILKKEQKKEKAALRAMTLANKSLSKKNILKQDRTDLITKINASVMANDIFNDLLPAAMASISKKRGRPAGSGKKKA